MSERRKIVVLDDYQQVASSYARWSELGPDTDLVFVREHLLGQDLVDVLADAEVCVAMRERTPLTRALMEQLPALRLVVTAGMTNAVIDLDAAGDLGIAVSGTRRLDGPAAELTWALILATLRHLPAEDAAVREGRWQLTVGRELEGSTLGIIGLGRLGQRVARVGLAFGMSVRAWSPNLTVEVADSLGVEAVGRDELLSTADVVTLHVRLTPDSRNLIGAPELRLMKPTSVLVNTSRGELVDETALLAALREGRIGGAGLDVFHEEPLPVSHPLRSSPRTVLTPHLGYVVDGSYRLYFGDAVEDILAWRAGQPIRIVRPD